MKIPKNTTIRYINNGEYKSLKVIYVDNYENSIPIYYSDDIIGVKVLELLGNEFVVIVDNPQYRLSTDTQIRIIHGLLVAYYRRYNKVNMIDLCCAYWFGFTNVIEIIQNTDYDEAVKLKRIAFLESMLTTKHKVHIPDKYNMISNIKYIDVV